MSIISCLIIFSPILIGCFLATAVDIGARVHGGWATPTPVVDLACAVVRTARMALSAIPVASAIGAGRGGRA